MLPTPSQSHYYVIVSEGGASEREERRFPASEADLFPFSLLLLPLVLHSALLLLTRTYIYLYIIIYII